MPGIFLGFALIAGGLWKGDILIADLEELDNLEASEVYPRRINAKEVLIRQLIFPFADGAAKLSGEGCEFREPTLRQESTARSEILREEFQGEPEGSQPTEMKDGAEALADFRSIQGDFINRRHIEPRVQLHVPREESFLIPPKYIDAIRSTHTDLDVAQEKRVHDCWNVDGNRNLSDSWTGFTRITLLNETPPKGYL